LAAGWRLGPDHGCTGRRLADPQRPQIELDYIERLLKDY
jgi:hypothetical protein